jgi:hypothetical protein
MTFFSLNVIGIKKLFFFTIKRLKEVKLCQFSLFISLKKNKVTIKLRTQEGREFLNFGILFFC